GSQARVPRPHSVSVLAQHGHAGDGKQRPLLRRSRFRQRLSTSVSAPSEAWRFLQGASPC
ncbi:MAG: hypothetical protein ACREOH_06250, partial [Candidatus Entotheonellia bacterium]